MNSTMCSVMFSSHERINVSHFWLSDATTTSENKLKKSKYLKKLKIMIQHQLSMCHSHLIQIFSFILIMRSLNHWRQFKISWYKFIKTRIIALAADHKICYYWKKIEDLIIINDLNFSKFILMITKKLKYNNWQDMIVYERIGMTTMHIANKLKWRTALSEMHTERSIQFFFAIKRRTERTNCKFVDIQHKINILI